jgi:hypothetical protein
MRAVYGSAVAVLPKLQDDFLCWFEAHFEHGDLADHRIGIMAWIPDDNEMIRFMLKWSGLAGFHQFAPHGCIFDAFYDDDKRNEFSEWLGENVTYPSSRIVALMQVEFGSQKALDDFHDRLECWEMMVMDENDLDNDDEDAAA